LILRLSLVLRWTARWVASSAAKHRAGQLRNGANPLGGMFRGENDVDPLAAFLRALNEDSN
jgi:hypothetical protein